MCYSNKKTTNEQIDKSTIKRGKHEAEVTHLSAIQVKLRLFRLVTVRKLHESIPLEIEGG